MCAPTRFDTVITPVNVAGRWCVVKVENATTTTYYYSEETLNAARFKAIDLAHLMKLPYIEYEFLLDKPVITVFNHQKAWQVLKVFYNTYDVKSIITDKEEALNKAREIAEKEKLDFLPLLGDAVFKDLT